MLLPGSNHFLILLVDVYLLHLCYRREGGSSEKGREVFFLIPIGSLLFYCNLRVMKY